MTRRPILLIVAAFWLLTPAWADVTTTVAMVRSQTLDLDTGALGGGSSADLVYTGQNGVLGTLGNGTQLTFPSGFSYDALTQVQLGVLPGYAAAQIADQTLTPGVILAAKTKTGKYSKIQVVANVFGTLVLTFNTYTTPLDPRTPFIRAVQNNYGQIPAGLPNHALAPGSLFFIKGSFLSPVNDGQALRSSAAPGLQETVEGVRVTVTRNGISRNCPIYYLSPGQINAVLPGNTPIGQGTIAVTTPSGTSATVPITVAQSAFGVLNYNGTQAATYDANNALITRLNAANPGQTIVIWGSGVGGDTTNDDRLFPQKTNNLSNIPLLVLVGGRSATLLYRGRSQFPGLDQIVATLPADVPTGCYIPLTVISGSIVSNGVTIPVAASGKTCSDANDPLTPALIQTLSAKTITRVGYLEVSGGADLDYGTATGSYTQGHFHMSNNLGRVVGNFSVSVGHCISTVSGTYAFPQIGQPLDVGLAINVTGPQGSVLLSRKDPTSDTRYLPASDVPRGFVPASGGSFLFENFSGGSDVARFSALVSTPANFVWTNSAAMAVIDRSGPATVTWSGGGTAAYVEIRGTSHASTAPYFKCLAPVGPGQFTIPASVLFALPAGPGAFSVTAVSRPLFFTAPTLDHGFLTGTFGFSRSVRF